MIIAWIITHLRTNTPANLSSNTDINQPRKKSLPEALQQYLITTRANLQTGRRSIAYTAKTSLDSEIQRQLVFIEC